MTNDFSSKYLFVVDDTSFMRANLIKLLVDYGFDRKNIFQFENGHAALTALTANPNRCDLVLCDWNMPVMTGVEFLKNVRITESNFKTIPFVLITTESEKDKVIEALKYKPNGYILKPIDEERLKEVIDIVFSTEGDGDD